MFEVGRAGLEKGECATRPTLASTVIQSTAHWAEASPHVSDGNLNALPQRSGSEGDKRQSWWLNFAGARSACPAKAGSTSSTQLEQQVHIRTPPIKVSVDHCELLGYSIAVWTPGLVRAEDLQALDTWALILASSQCLPGDRNHYATTASPTRMQGLAS
jgi:hypothetical protein